MIRTAILSDLNQIMEIVEVSKLDMNSYDNFQWNENYPKESDFIKGINLNFIRDILTRKEVIF